LSVCQNFPRSIAASVFHDSPFSGFWAMHDPASKPPFNPSIPVSPNNPCPFLRGLVGEGFVDGGTVPLNTLSQTIANASGEKGLKKVSARIQVRGIALIANGLGHIFKSIWSGARLDVLRNGPLDKHGS